MVYTTLKDKCHRRKTTVGMWTYTAVIGIGVLRNFHVGVMKQEEWIDLVDTLGGKRLTNGDAAHVVLGGV